MGTCQPFMYNCNNLDVYIQSNHEIGGVFSNCLTEYIRTILCTDKKIDSKIDFPIKIKDLYKYLTHKGSNSSYDFLAIENLWSEINYLEKTPIDQCFDEIDEFFKDKINFSIICLSDSGNS